MGKTFKDNPDKFKYELEAKRRKKEKKKKIKGDGGEQNNIPWDPWANVQTDG